MKPNNSYIGGILDSCGCFYYTSDKKYKTKYLRYKIVAKTKERAKIVKETENSFSDIM